MREILGPGLEAFGGTKDKGRDCIFKGKAPYPSTADQWDGTWVIQVKFSNSDQVGALNSEKIILGAFNSELTAIRNRNMINFDNYLFVTNISLSSTGRDNLEKLFLDQHPKVNFRSIDGKDICDLLSSKQEIRQSFPQLLGLADLSRILNHDIYEKAEAFLGLAKQETAAFVRHSHYENALEILIKKHFIVLDGPPEVGKTTIAYAIALRYAANGFHIVDISGSSEAFFKGCESNQPTLFIADDAVGSITFESNLGEMWARDLGKMLIKLDSKHKLVWTTRRYILEDALSRTKINEVVASFPKENDILISVDQYSYMERAEMLYNHSKIRSLSDIARLAIKKAGMSIIKSNDFTPLRLKQFLDNVLPDCEEKEMPVNEIAKQFIQYCENPNERWSKAYSNLSDNERILLISLIDCGGIAALEDLKNSFTDRCSEAGLSSEFERCVQKLTNSFIKEVVYFAGNSTIQFQHPSLRDMVLRRIHSDSRSKLQYIKLASLSSLTSIVNNLLENPKSSDDLHEVVVDSIASKNELINRISQLGSRIIDANRWSALIKSLNVLLKKIETSNSDEIQVENAREIINTIVSVTCSEDFFKKQETWSPAQWNSNLEGLLQLLNNKSIKSEGPRYWTNACTLFINKADFLEGIEFISLATQWAPGIVNREMGSSLEIWTKQANKDALECLAEAPEEGDCPEYKFDNWWERSRPTYKVLKILKNVTHSFDSDIIDQIDEKHDSIKVIQDDEDDYEPPPDDIDDWTINKLLEDI